MSVTGRQCTLSNESALRSQECTPDTSVCTVYSEASEAWQTFPVNKSPFIATQLNSTSSWVELRRYKRAFMYRAFVRVWNGSLTNRQLAVWNLQSGFDTDTRPVPSLKHLRFSRDHRINLSARPDFYREHQGWNPPKNLDTNHQPRRALVTYLLLRDRRKRLGHDDV